MRECKRYFQHFPFIPHTSQVTLLSITVVAVHFYFYLKISKSEDRSNQNPEDYNRTKEHNENIGEEATREIVSS